MLKARAQLTALAVLVVLYLAPALGFFLNGVSANTSLLWAYNLVMFGAQLRKLG